METKNKNNAALLSDAEIKQKKAQIRRSIRQQRRSLTIKEQQKAAENLFVNLSKLSVFRQAKHIAFYHPDDGEIDPTLALLNALGRGKQCYYPLVFTSKAPRLFFVPVNERTKFRSDIYGIPTPVVPSRLWKRPSDLDVVFMPLVGFSQDGLRVGRGGGYYDASFAFLANRVHMKRPLLVGIAHELQRVDNIHGEPWDVPLNCIVTDKSLYNVS